MGWFTKLIGFAAIVGAAFVTFGGSLAAAGAWLASGSIGAIVARTVIAIGISKLIANRTASKAAGGDAPSARFQVRPATVNKIPLVYGSGFYGSVITDAIISTDNTTMWYVMACSEVTDAGSLTFGNIYIDNRLVTFDGTDQTKVVSLTNNAGQVDTKMDGNIFIYKYDNGSNSPVNTAQTAIQVLQDSAIPISKRWTSNHLMSNTAFIIVKLIYNYEKQVTGLGEIKLNMINSLNKPGDVLLDYMTNTRYGCAIPLTQIDTASLTLLNDYSDELITYTPVGGGSATQERYRINGPIDLNQSCLTNIQQICDACDSWIQYSELVGKWKVVINKPYDWVPSGPSPVITDLYHVNSDVLIGGIDITPIDLNQTYNSIEIQYPNNNIKDQTDIKVIDLTDPTTTWYDPTILSPGEANNRLTIQYNIVNNYVQGVYLGVRRLLQSREDLTIQCNLDYSGIQIEAGDVVRVTLEEYGWCAPVFPDGKLFRVSTVTEIKKEDGNLGASIVAFEYNDTIYGDNAIQDYVPADNTGLTDPNIIGTPAAPTVVLDVANTISTMTITGTVPSLGTVLYLDFNYGTSSNSQTHNYYSTAKNKNGSALTPNANLSISSTDLPANTYYWSITARNNNAGVRGPSSTSVVWPGASVTSYDANTNSGGIANTNIKDNTILSNNIANNTILSNNIANNTILANNVANFTLTSNTMSNTGVTSGTYTTANITVDAAGRVTSASNGVAGISGITVQDEGSNILVSTSTLNFVGAGVSVSNVANVATITIANATGQAITVYNSNVTLTSNLSSINFTGTGVNATANGSNVTVAFTGVGAYKQIIDLQARYNYGSNSGIYPSNAFSSSFRKPQSYRIPAQIQFTANGGTGAYSVTDYDPFFQNTSSTANGFLANSTDTLDPPRAAYQQISVPGGGGSQTSDGGYGWIMPLYTAPDGPYDRSVDIIYLTEGAIQVVSDTDTTIQCGGCVTIYWDGNSVFIGNFVDYNTVNTIDLKANKPQTVSFNFLEQGAYISPNSYANGQVFIYGTGYAVRNPGSGNLWYVSGSIVTSKLTGASWQS